MTPEQAANEIREAVVRVPGGFMTDAGTYGRGAELGFQGLDFYAAGRGGVLGEVHADIVVAAFVFFAPEVVHEAWARSASVMPRAEAARAWAAVGHTWATAHLADDNDWEAGFDRWRKALAYLETDVAVYLENTAGGDHAMARHFDTIARLWARIADTGIGFCLDTCHAWAAGEELIDAVERIKAITGRIDLVHCNDSRDAKGSGADRHANFGTGQIDPQLLVAVVQAAGAPVICETADEGRKDDIAFLREHLS